MKKTFKGRTMKKTFLIILALIMCLSASLMFGCGEDTKSMQFGLYPQTDVTEEMKSELSSYTTKLPSSTDSGDWTDCGYYKNNLVSKYMWYKDVTHTDGNQYRAIFFKEYRPYFTNTSSSARNSYQDENGYKIGKVYWFRFDPVEWDILEKKDGFATLLSTVIIDSQAYQNSFSQRGPLYYNNNADVPSNVYYANNYELSFIRAWLNDNFYNTAFSAEEKERIQLTTIDNSANSTGYDENGYACGDLEDKVFLLSFSEAMNSNYGFSPNGNSAKDREKKSTDYAKSQGCYTSNTDNIYGNSYWWLRSPDVSDSRIVRNVGMDGNIIYVSKVNNAYYGVVPAIKIKL